MTLIAPHRSGFKSGTNSYVETQGKTGMDFDIFIAAENENLELKDDEKEIAIVVIEGKGEIEFQGETIKFDRPNWIDCDPTVVHMGPGENVKIRRIKSINSGDAHLGHYMHGSKIGVVVILEKENIELAKDICMHIAAMKPAALKSDDIPKEDLEKEREIYICLLYTSPSPRDRSLSRMPSSA